MTVPVQLVTMRSDVRRHANMENSTFVTDAELNGKLNYYLRQLYNHLIETEACYYVQTATFTTVAGKSFYDFFSDIGAAIPGPSSLYSNFYKLAGLDINYNGPVGGPYTFSAKRFSNSERNNWTVPYPYAVGGYPTHYRIWGNGLMLQPACSVPFQIGLNYYPTYVSLLNDTDKFDGVNGFEEFAVYKTTAYCLGKQETDPTFWELQAQNLLNDIKQFASQRDEGEPERCPDVYSQPGGFGRSRAGW